MALYMTDKAGGTIASDYAKLDDSAKIFLIQDGLYLPSELFEGKEVYVLIGEVEERGLNGILPESYKRVEYSDIIDLLIDEKVISFC